MTLSANIVHVEYWIDDCYQQDLSNNIYQIEQNAHIGTPLEAITFSYLCARVIIGKRESDCIIYW